MRVGVVGVGRAGCALAEALLADDAARAVDYLTDVVALDTDAGDLRECTRIPEDRRHLLGVPLAEGEGTAGDVELAAEIAREESAELRAALDAIPVGRTDATLVACALGGGTGAGVAPAVAEALDRLTDAPVVAVGVLPGTAEAGGDGGATDVTGTVPRSAEDEAASGPDRPLAANAAGAVRALTAAAEDLICADPDVWRASGSPYPPAWEALDETVARRLGELFAAGEREDPVPERVLDASELSNTFGAGGVAVLCGAETGVETGRREGVVGGLLDRLGGGAAPEVDEGEAVSVATNTARKAVTHRVSLPCDVGSAARAAVTFSAPPAWLSRRGVERAHGLIVEETGAPEIRWGDVPDPDAETFRVTALLTGVTVSERLAALGDAGVPVVAEEE